MPSDRSRDARTDPRQVGYLLVHEGDILRDTTPLIPGQVMTIGRAPTNRVVIRDDLCSRNHCEVFQVAGHWTLRDLGSRNGTLVNGRRLVTDHVLDDGDEIRIGKFLLDFTFDLARPLKQVQEAELRRGESDTAMEMPVYLGDTPSAAAPPDSPKPAIVHRRRQTRYQTSDSAIDREVAGGEMKRLYRLALEMGACRDCRSLCDTVLSALLKSTPANIGAILLLPVRDAGEATPERLQVVAYRVSGDQPYERVSDTLSRAALVDGEAILADVQDDSRLKNRGSLGEIQAQTVICAPIRTGDRIDGLIHLYCTSIENPLDENDLEFTLAVADHLGVALSNLQEWESLQAGLARVEDENETLRQQLELDDRLVGDSPSMQKLRQTIGRVAATSATALIRGESGVGKELVARAVHRRSDRKGGPFVTMNCAALAESLLESELFGHEKGSFTGAIGRKIGKFEQAHRGTLFLDEVGEMSLPIQAKFLRVLEGHPFERVGGGSAVLVDVRVVAATNRDLEKAVHDGNFRRDLYFRLHVLEITIDPLRRRRSDISLLVNHFLERFSRKTGRPLKRLTREALEGMLAYEWPGNVRELQNVVERACILSSDSDWIGPADIHLTNLAGTAELGYQQVSLDALEQQHILATLEKTKWNKSQAAQILGIERSTLDRKLKRYEVERPK